MAAGGCSHGLNHLEKLLCYPHVGYGKFKVKFVHLFYDKALT